MQIKRSLATWQARLFNAIEATLFLLVLAVLVLVGLQVFTRYVMQAAVPWTEEVARMAIVWIVMLGAAVAMERKQHYAIKVLADHFHGRIKVLVLFSTNLIGVAFLCVLTIYGMQYVLVNVQSVYVSTGILRSWVYLALPVGALLMALSLIAHSIEAVDSEKTVATQEDLMDTFKEPK